MNDLLTASAIGLAVMTRPVESVAAEVADLVAQRGIDPETALPWRDRDSVRAMLRLHRRAQAGEFLDLADLFKETAANVGKWTGQSQNELRLAGYESVGWFLRQGHGRWTGKEETDRGQRLVEAYADKHLLAPKRLRKGKFTVYYWPTEALKAALAGDGGQA